MVLALTTDDVSDYDDNALDDHLTMMTRNMTTVKEDDNDYNVNKSDEIIYL